MSFQTCKCNCLWSTMKIALPEFCSLWTVFWPETTIQLVAFAFVFQTKLNQHDRPCCVWKHLWPMHLWQHCEKHADCMTADSSLTMVLSNFSMQMSDALWHNMFFSTVFFCHILERSRCHSSLLNPSCESLWLTLQPTFTPPVSVCARGNSDRILKMPRRPHAVCSGLAGVRRQALDVRSTLHCTLLLH